MATQDGQYLVLRATDTEPATPVGLEQRTTGLRRAALVGRDAGAVHAGLALCEMDHDGRVARHLHSAEQSFYVLSGSPTLIVQGRPHLLAPDACGLLPVGVEHAWRNDSGAPAHWLEVNAPVARVAGPPDTFWTGDVGSASPAASAQLDIRDPRSRTFFRLDPGQMDVDQLKLGAAADAPTVSASMATALLAYSGIAVKMLVDQRLGAVLHTMFMVEYQPGGVAQPHDHPLEEIYHILDGEVQATAGDQAFTLRPGDTFWTGVGCVHSFHNRGPGRVRWLETQSPQPPANHSYRFNRDWEYLAARLADAQSATEPAPSPDAAGGRA
ncbi:MAG: cupin domain-containing protein [Solirubrobacteraceae bacterium]